MDGVKAWHQHPYSEGLLTVYQVCQVWLGRGLNGGSERDALHTPLSSPPKAVHAAMLAFHFHAHSGSPHQSAEVGAKPQQAS